MTAGNWLRLRGAELLAALCAGTILIGGAAAGVPLLRARAVEVALYSFCCLSAVVLRGLFDVTALGVIRLARVPGAIRVQALRAMGSMPLRVRLGAARHPHI